MQTLVYFVEALLRHPIVILPPGVVVAILYGAGKVLGLPSLFWHERRRQRFFAGVATTLLAAESFLVAYLLDRVGVVGERTTFSDFLFAGAVVWLLVIGGRSLFLSFRHARSRRHDGSIRTGVGVAPGIRTVGLDGLAQTASLQVPAEAFMAGVVVGGAIAFLLVFVAGLIPLRTFSAVSPWGSLSDPQLHLLALICVIVLLTAFVLLRRRASPAVGICMLLALVVAVYAAIEFWARSAGLGLLVLLVLLWWAGGLRYKLRIPSLRDVYRHPLPYPPPTPNQAAKPAPLPFDVALDAKNGKPHRLIIVCASGGGIRAAIWTAAILGRLDEIDGFRAAARLLTGASGGMMGAASWVAFLAKIDSAPEPIPTGTWKSLMRAVAMDSLTPVSRQLVFHDIPLAFIARNNLHDRARALEEAWCENLRKSKLNINLGISLADLRSSEESGRLPSLVLSPMLVEDGRRLILSNLDLTQSTDHYVRWLSSKATGTEPVTGRASRTAYHLSQLCPEGWDQFPLSTAVRLSASFPYVSPAVLFPSEPRRRVVDAGYYDNYGLELACNWLRELIETRKSFLERNISGILLIQIRDNVSQLSVNPESEEPRQTDRSGSRLSRSLEGLSSPPEGLLTARESVMLFRNDSQLETISHLYASAFESEDFLTTTVFEFAGEASLSWHLASEEVQLIQQQAESKGIGLKLEAIRAWIHQRDYWSLTRPERCSPRPAG